MGRRAAIALRLVMVANSLVTPPSAAGKPEVVPRHRYPVLACRNPLAKRGWRRNRMPESVYCLRCRWPIGFRHRPVSTAPDFPVARTAAAGKLCLLDAAGIADGPL